MQISITEPGKLDKDRIVFEHGDLGMVTITLKDGTELSIDEFHDLQTGAVLDINAGGTRILVQPRASNVIWISEVKDRRKRD